MKPRLKPRLLAAVALGLLALAVVIRLWNRHVVNALDRWAVEEVTRRTDGAYRLVVRDLSFHPLAGSVSFDSAAIATDSARNRRRPSPLPGLAARGDGCSLSGVDLIGLVFRRSFQARELECRRMAVTLTLPPRADSAATEAEERELSRPLGLSEFRIRKVSLPQLSLRLERLGRDGDGSIVLEQARFEGADLALDLTPETGAGHGFSAGRADLVAKGLTLRPDSAITIAVAGLEASLTDSTLVLHGVEREHSMSDEEWVRRQRFRDDRIGFALDSLRGRGVAFRAFIASGDIGARALELVRPRLDVLSDKRLPRGLPRRRRIPREAAARFEPPVRVDTVLVTGGTITYREREPERERPGVVSFDAVRGTILDLHLPPGRKPLGIVASARLMGAGPLTVEAVVPLDAPDFRYDLTGRLGKMPAKAFNRFLKENEAFVFDDGTVEEVVFRQTVRGGRAVTIATPRYRELGVDPSDDGGGVVGSVKRAVKNLVAGAFVLRSSNPDDDGENLRTARTIRRYDRRDTWLQFAWFSLRDGLRAALKE